MAQARDGRPENAGRAACSLPELFLASDEFETLRLVRKPGASIVSPGSAQSKVGLPREGEVSAREVQAQRLHDLGLSGIWDLIEIGPLRCDGCNPPASRADVVALSDDLSFVRRVVNHRDLSLIADDRRAQLQCLGVDTVANARQFGTFPRVDRGLLIRSSASRSGDPGTSPCIDGCINDGGAPVRRVGEANAEETGEIGR